MADVTFFYTFFFLKMNPQSPTFRHLLWLFKLIFAFIYGLVIVGSTDNIIRLYVLKRLDNVHPLITLIGVIVGVPLFGFIGLIFGPLLISLFLIVLRIYRKEYGKEEGV